MKSKQIIKKVIVRAGDRRDGKDTEEIEQQSISNEMKLSVKQLFRMD